MAGMYCCCCTSHLDAAKFIGITYLVLHIIGLVLMCVLLGELEFIEVAIGTLVALALVDCGLIYGSFNKNGCLLMTWSVVTVIFTVLESILVVSISFNLVIFLVDIAIFVVNIWAILTVNKAKSEIDQEKRNAVISIAGQEVASNIQIKCIA